MNSCSNSPSFFKIILHDTLRDKKLELPRKFISMYRNELSRQMILNIRNGEKWPVEIFKWDEAVFLRDGLQDFMEFYSLIYGSVLFFEFDRKNICFNVIIFDESTVEIDYPISILEESDIEELSTRKSNGKSPFSVPPRPSEQLNVDHEEESEVKAGERIVSSYRSLTRNETLNFIRKTRAKFSSKNPYFILVMQTSYVDPEYNFPSIPKVFAVKFLRKYYEDVIFKGADGRSWSIAYSNSLSRARFHVGWRKFAQDNQIEAGDVCAFEMMNRAKITFKVTIFRDIKPANFCLLLGKRIVPMQRSLTREETKNLIQKANSKLASKFPYFIIAMQPSLVDPVYNIPTIPKVFACKYFRKDHDDVIFNGPDGRSWSLEYINSYSDGKERRRFHVGWKQFVQDNQIKAGDVCAFEMINSARSITFRVTIFRDIKIDSFCPSPGDNNQSKTKFAPGPSKSSEHKRQKNFVDLCEID
ncbi:B3 domain-containing transcription factor VRN1-like isoform X2 [Mercurialis annua]|uniref:B3 domain-containing transcription factor VRN1-like isoform X2 n=1 Tax=Mercurialis annua TaxID=3986 RepID=UPI00215EED7D|nr:B3 domain-containing transcription factor VRN1-like isoform X2 [Mercurialis annua]